MKVIFIMNEREQWWYVYILRCADGTIYTGCTSNLIRRMEEHNNRDVNYTRDKIPLRLLTYITFKEKNKAFFFEKYLKSGSGKAFLNKRLI